MCKLTLKILALLLPFAAGFGLLEHRLRQLPNFYSRTREALEPKLPTVQVLLFGSSHAQSGFDTRAFTEPAFNLGAGSQSLYYDAKLAEKFAPQAPALRLVVFCVSYFSFESRLDRSVESWRAGFYRQVFGLQPEEEKSPLSSLRDHSYVLLYSPRLAYRLALDSFTQHDESKFDAAAAARDAAGRGDVSDAVGAERVRFHEATMYREFAGYNRAALEHACHVLADRGVAVAFLTTPVHHSYLDHVDARAYARMQEDAVSIASACKANYVNYVRDVRFETDDFINSDHLNPRGAIKLTHIVDEEIVRPTLARRRP